MKPPIARTALKRIRSYQRTARFLAAFAIVIVMATVFAWARSDVAQKVFRGPLSSVGTRIFAGRTASKPSPNAIPLTPKPSAPLAAFTLGNLVIDRVGDGTIALTSAASRISLVELTTAGGNPAGGANVITLPLNGSANTGLVTDVGSATAAGHLNRSLDGRFLVLTGYDAPEGTGSLQATTSAANNRNVAKLDATAAVTVPARLTDAYSANSVRSAATDIGATFYLGGATNVRYADASVSTATTSTAITSSGSTRDVVLATDANGNKFLIESLQTSISYFTGLPTSSSAPTSIGLTLTDANSFVFLDRSSGVGATGLGGLDTLYVADGSSTGATGTAILRKFEWNGSAWTAMGTATMAASGSKLFGLTYRIAVNGSVELYATTMIASNNSLVSFTDTTNFNAFGGTISGTLSTIVSAGSNFAFRGVAFAPELLSVTASSPADAAANVATNSNVSVTFNTAVDRSTITTQSTSGACTGSLQVASDGTFTNCIGLGTPVASGGNTVFTSTPSSALSNSTTYKIRVTTAAKTATGSPLAAAFTQTSGFTTATPNPTVTTIGGPLTFATTNNGAFSAEQTYTVSGSNLTADIIVTAPSTDFQVSATSGTGFGSSITFTQSGGTVATSTVFVRFSPQSGGAKSGNITNTSTGATTQNVAVNGSGCLATITVNDLGDGPDAAAGNGVCATSGGVCTLRAAIQEANSVGACAGSVAINISVTGTIQLNSLSALPNVTRAIVINGPGTASLTIDALQLSSIGSVQVSSPDSVTFSNLTMAHGSATSSTRAGGLTNLGSGTLNITNCLMYDDYQPNGTGNGGALYQTGNGTINITDTTLRDNFATNGSGAALFNSTTGSVNILRSTFNNNTSPTGGAITLNGAAVFNATNSTFSNNNGGGSGIMFVSAGTANFTNCTITANSGGGAAILSIDGAVNLKNSIVAQNNSDLMVQGGGSGTFVSQGYNLIGNNNNVTTAFPAGSPNANNDYVGTNALPMNAMLAGLANNGGPTQTHALLPGSIAFDKGSAGVSTDQRGLTRPFNNTFVAGAPGGNESDIGAFEEQTSIQPPETTVAVSGGNLTITDANGGTTDDTLTISLVSGNIQISDPNHVLSAGAGVTQIDPNTVQVPTGTVTFFQIDTLGGNDTVTLDLAGGDFIPSGGLTFNGGAQTATLGDKLIILGGSQGAVTFNYTNAHDGSVVMANFGTVNYTGLEPLSNNGTMSDIVFNLPAGGTNAATLADDGTSANTMSRLSAATIETTDFANPTGSVTINRGNPTDTLAINALPDLNSALTLGSGALPFSALTFNGAVTLASGKSLSGDATGTISFPNTTSDIATTGVGTLTLTTARNISLVADASIRTVDGALTLSANQQGTPTTGNFVGVDVSGFAALIQVIGTGALTVMGKGGDDAGGSQIGVRVNGSGDIIGGTTGLVTVQGRGGAGATVNNFGVQVINGSGGSISSAGANVSVTGNGGGTGSSTSNHGVICNTGGQISAGGSGTVTVTGFGGNLTGTGGSNSGVFVATSGAQITSSGGKVTVTGTGGGPATGSFDNSGVFVTSTNPGGGQITAGGSGAVEVVGHGAATTGTSQNNYGVFVDSTNAIITSSGGNVSVTGDGGAAGTATNNVGVFVRNAGQVTAGGSGTVTVLGQGGSSTSTGSGNQGVTVALGNAMITSAGGNVSVTGTGGGAGATSGSNQGIAVINNAQITAGGSGTVTVIGQDGNGSAGSDVGVDVSGASAAITSGGGNVTVTGTEGTGSGSNAIHIATSGSITTATNGGTLTLAGNSMNFDNTATISAQGGSSVTLRQRSNPVAINLGAATNPNGGPLSLTDAELDRVTAGTINIGDANSDTITVSADITRAAATILNLTSTASVDLTTGGLDSAGGNVTLNPDTNVFPSKSAVDVTTGAAATLAITSGKTLKVVINSTTLDTGYTQLNVAGLVNISGVNLSLSGSYVPTGGQTFTIVNNDSNDPITGTFVGLAQGATITNFLGSGLNATISYTGGDGNDVVITVAGSDYTVTTTGNAIVVTDVTGHSDPLGMTEPASGQVSFNAPGRTFIVDGGAPISGNSGNISLTGINSITVNENAGNDGFFVGTFAGQLPSLTINGGTGNDNVQFSGAVTFAPNANLDIDMQNDDPTPGLDRVDFFTGGQLHLSGTGTATIKVSQAMTMVGAGTTLLEVQNGNLTIEINQQATPTTGASAGLFLNGGALKTTGTGNINVLGKGQAQAAGGNHTGLAIVGGATISSTSAAVGAGSITLNGTGAQGTTINMGVDLESVGTVVSSVTGDISITGHGGAGSANRNYGVEIQSGSVVQSTGAAKITINGTGGSGTSTNWGARLEGNDTKVTSSGGDISITGQGGSGTTGHTGVGMLFGSLVSAANGAKITIDGTGGTGTGSGMFGVGISFTGTQTIPVPTMITSDSGDIAITGHGGSAPGGANIGFNLDSGAQILATGSANVTLNGTGGSTGASDNYGVGFEGGATDGTTLSSVNGNLNITGVATAATGTDQDGVRFEDSGGANPFLLKITGAGALNANGTAGNNDPTSSGINFVNNTTVTLNGLFNNFFADTIDIANTNVSITVNAGSGGTRSLGLGPKTSGRAINVGGADSATELGLTDAELDVIAAPLVAIGRGTAGPITVTSSITRTAATELLFFCAANMDISGGSIDSGGGIVDLEPGTYVFPSRSGVDVNSGLGTFIPAGRMLKLVLDSTTLDSGYTQFNVNGTPIINNVTLSLSGSYVPVVNDTFTIVNNGGALATAGTFTGLPEGAFINNFLGSSLRAKITYLGGTGNDVVLTVMAAPTASLARISGQIFDTAGQPVSGANVTVSGGPRLVRAITDAHGFYHVDSLPVGDFYTVTPGRANYVFAPINRTFSLQADKTDAVFTGNSITPDANPLESPEFFVRQQYLDFLNREPDQDGLDFWSGQLRACVADLQCLKTGKLTVSAAFFSSAEFQLSGSYIYRLYRAGLGRQLTFAEFNADHQQVIGGADLESQRTQFAADFVARPEFVAQYQNTVTAETFVEALLQRVLTDTEVDLSSRRETLIATYNHGADLNQSRSAVLRAVAERAEFKTKVYNPSFVLMEYFGYLQRDAENSGFDFWLQVLNRTPGNFRGMVCSFTTSAEYQRRFGPVVVHSNGECAQEP